MPLLRGTGPKIIAANIEMLENVGVPRALAISVAHRCARKSFTQDQVPRIRGLRLCSHCLRSSPNDARYCVRCGKVIATKVKFALTEVMSDFMLLASAKCRTAESAFSPKAVRELIPQQASVFQAALKELRLLGVFIPISDDGEAKFSAWGRELARQLVLDIERIQYPIIVEI